MNKERIKLIIRNMELLLEGLKKELNSDFPSEEDLNNVEMYDEK